MLTQVALDIQGFAIKGFWPNTSNFSGPKPLLIWRTLELLHNLVIQIQIILKRKISRDTCTTHISNRRN